MKKVLIISGGPRKGGNSDMLCDQFAKGAAEAGHEVKKLQLADKKIGFCTGCYACKTGTCPQKDDVSAMLEDMLAADVLVLATPVYFYTMCAQLKALIDRSVAVYPKIVNKQFYYIMAMADTNNDMFKGTVEALRGFLDCCEGSAEAGIIYGSGAYQKGEIKNLPAWDEAYKMGLSVK